MTKKKKSKRHSCFFVFLMMLLIPQLAHAQTYVISGIITDT